MKAGVRRGGAVGGQGRWGKEGTAPGLQGLAPSLPCENADGGSSRMTKRGALGKGGRANEAAEEQ